MKYDPYFVGFDDNIKISPKIESTKKKMPNMITSQKTTKSVRVDVNKFYKEKKTKHLRTGYENECLTKPYLNKCKQLNERKFY
jgi:hypothetical protein